MIKSIIGILIQLSYPGPTVFAPKQCHAIPGEYAIMVIDANCTPRFYISASEKDNGKIFMAERGYPLGHNLELARSILRATGITGKSLEMASDSK